MSTTLASNRTSRPHAGLGAAARLGGASPTATQAADVVESMVVEGSALDVAGALDALVRRELVRRPGAFDVAAPELAGGAADLADWLVATGRIEASLGREIAIHGRHAAVELRAIADLRRAVEDTIDGIGSHGLGEELDLGAVGGTIVSVLPGSLWIAGPSGETIGPVRVAPAASATARAGWRLAPLRLVRSWAGEWLIAELGAVIPAWGE